MSDQVLTLELNNLVNESKRKFPDIKTAAEASLQDLKSCVGQPPHQVALVLSEKPDFIHPFVLACASHNVKLASSAVVCLQRLIASRGLAVTRLRDALLALGECTELSLEVQLKVLQVLPALAQSYAADLQGELLTAALQVCTALLVVKAQTISGVATATFLQLVLSVFEKISTQTATQTSDAAVESVQIEVDDQTHQLTLAQFDGYRVWSELAAITSDDDTDGPLQLSRLPPSLALETAWTCLSTYSNVFVSRPELVFAIKSSFVPFLMRVLSERQPFALTVRSMRLALLILQKHLRALPDECEILLGLLTNCLEPEAAPFWKRVMCLEIYKGLYAYPGLTMQMYAQYDQIQGKKNIVRDNIAAFVRLAAENPSAIGIGRNTRDDIVTSAQATSEQHVIEAGGVVGVISSALSVAAPDTMSIGTSHSVPRVPCLECLDKSEPPTLSESYMPSLVIDCLNHISGSMARLVIPLTVYDANKGQGKSKHESGEAPSTEVTQAHGGTVDKLTRSQSLRSRSLPHNPLQSSNPAVLAKASAIASLVEECWPAILATSSTLFSAMLDNDFIRNMIRSFQRFTQVASLLELVTARDAFLTALSKLALPPPSAQPANAHGPASPTTMRSFSSSLYMTSRNFLHRDSVDSNATESEKAREHSSESTLTPLLDSRNLLCLRALLNLAIAVGPVMGEAIAIILRTLRQADLVLSYMQRNAALSGDLAAESNAVYTATLRFLDSTSDYPNEYLSRILEMLCRTLNDAARGGSPKEPSSPANFRPSLLSLGRQASLPLSPFDPNMRAQDALINLNKIKRIAELNIVRFAHYQPTVSGWNVLSETLTAVSISTEKHSEARVLAANTLVTAAVELAKVQHKADKNDKRIDSKSSLQALMGLTEQLGAISDTYLPIDVRIHGVILAAARDMVEACSETLDDGWAIILRLIRSVFVPWSRPSTDLSLDPDSRSVSILTHMSDRLIDPSLGRVSFGILQLVCSDFLGLLPLTLFANLIDIQYSFATQKVDLNMSLTTIALYLDVSNLLCKADITAQLRQMALGLADIDDEHLLQHVQGKAEGSSAALWIVLLHRLSALLADERQEIRHSAFHTIMSILTVQARQLQWQIWRLILQLVIFPIMQGNITRFTDEAPEVDASDRQPAQDTAVLVLEGTAKLLGANMKSIQSDPGFARSWTMYMAILKQHVSLRSHAINEHMFTALTSLMNALDKSQETGLTATKQVLDLWFESESCFADNKSTTDREQKALLAYCICAGDLIRALHDAMTAGDVKRLCSIQVAAVRDSKQVPPGGDTRAMTMLQANCMALLRLIKHEQAVVRQHLIILAANLIALPFDTEPKRPFSFVAMCKDAMDFLALLMTSNTPNTQQEDKTYITAAMQSLIIPIKLKYHWKVDGTPPVPWQKATQTMLKILPTILRDANDDRTDVEMRQKVWHETVSYARAVLQGDLSPLDIPASYADIERVENDEEFDIASLTALRTAIDVALGDSRLSASIRQEYAAALFDASIIHPERIAVKGTAKSDSWTAPLQGLLTVRLGQVYKVEASRREDLAYKCFEELIGLVSEDNDLLQPADTYNADSLEDMRTALSQAAAPHLLARFARSLKAYIADQPLRGSMPTPISMQEELAWCLKQMSLLRCNERAFLPILNLDPIISDDQRVLSTAQQCIRYGRSTVFHLDVLHPLLLQVVPIAGNSLHGKQDVLEKVTNLLSIAGIYTAP